MAESISDREGIARRIRTLRRARGLSIQRLAKAADMSAGYLSEVERAGSAASGEKLARLAENLGVTVDYLLSGRGEHTPGSTVNIPPELSEAAKTLDLSFTDTLRLLAGKESLVARRSGGAAREWMKEDWIEFHRKVKSFL